MIIDRNIGRYLAVSEESIRAGLKKIEGNEDGIIFCVTPEGELCGVLTDGDFRRWVMAQAAPDIDQPLRSIANTEFVFAAITDSEDKVRAQLSDRIAFIPLVDGHGRCVALARRRPKHVQLAGFRIGQGHPTLVIAEIGNNHNGSLELAKRLVDEAVAAGANCAKFQMRDVRTLYRNAGNANDASEDLNSQYTLDLVTRFQLPDDAMCAVFDHCHKRGILPLCTPWDNRSLEFLDAYGMAGFKVASADLTNHDFLRALARTGKPLICSTGMSTEKEVLDAVQVLKSAGAQFALLHCNSTYPAPFKDINLRYMNHLRAIGKCPVGYSSHDRGVHVAVAAVSIGADIIEKHFTVDRTMEGSDHRVSLLPGEFAEMVTAIRQVELALGNGEERRLSQGEMMNREALGKSLVINRDLPAGAVVLEHMIEVRSPGRGLAPYRRAEIVGKATTRPLSAGDILYASDFGEAAATSRSYRFGRPFGIPVRYHDLGDLAKRSNFDLLEFHLSYKDMDENIESYVTDVRHLDLIVHAPELFAGDHILDLCSPNEEYRRHSVRELARVIDITRQLRPFFTRATRPRIIVNVGGFTADAPLPPYSRKERYALVLQSLSELDTDGVEILPQTMPPFPWHFGGQRYQNLFVDPDEIADFCTRTGMRVCLDTSHSKLACTHFKWSLSDFIRKVGPHTAHLHIADARGVDGEGLQVGEGDIVFPALGTALRTHAPQASFIPEVWQGHKNGGEGFWLALERLEQYL